MDVVKKYNVAMLSGGKDSTAMVLRAAESGDFFFDEYVFCDTGKEFPAMYDHLEKLEKYMGISITRLKSDKSFEYYFSDYTRTKGNNINLKGMSWPDFRTRWCTTHLKERVATRYLRQFDNVVEFVGVAIDEWSKKKNAHRASNNSSFRRMYPLCYWAMTESECLSYCYERGFDWGGLYEDFGRVSCFCCPLSNLKELKVLWSKYPDLWKATREIEAGGTFRTFKPGYSLEQLERRFEIEELTLPSHSDRRQVNLFS